MLPLTIRTALVATLVFCAIYNPIAGILMVYGGLTTLALSSVFRMAKEVDEGNLKFF